MTVLLPDGDYSVRKRVHEYSRDEHGLPVTPSPGQAQGPWPGAATEVAGSDGLSWTMRQDPAMWPVRADDLVDGPGGRTWLVETAVLRVNNDDPAVDYVQITASLQPPRRV